MRATQLHEFPTQVIGMTREGTHASVFDIEVQPVAARTVARVLLEVSQGSPVERAPDLAGPRRERLVELARALAARKDPELEIRPDPGTMSGVPPGALLAGDGARLEGPSFQEWLDSEDAAALTI